MEKSDIITAGLNIIRPDPSKECQALAAKFRSALKTANATLTDAMLSPYDEAFAEQLPAIASMLKQVRFAATNAALSDEDVKVWRAVLERPELIDFLQSVQKITPLLDASTQKLFSTTGLAAHKKSAEKLFESLNAQQ